MKHLIILTFLIATLKLSSQNCAPIPFYLEPYTLLTTSYSFVDSVKIIKQDGNKYIIDKYFHTVNISELYLTLWQCGDIEVGINNRSKIYIVFYNSDFVNCGLRTAIKYLNNNMQ